jgi:hypothetical protein
MEARGPCPETIDYGYRAMERRTVAKTRATGACSHAIVDTGRRKIIRMAWLELINCGSVPSSPAAGRPKADARFA